MFYYMDCLLLLTLSLGLCSAKEENHDCPTTYIQAMGSKRKGVFYSPNYPHPYPPGANCLFVFEGGLNDRIKIEFKAFDLRAPDMTRNSTVIGCRLDYLDILAVNLNTHAIQFERRLCGSTLPDTYVSVVQRVELVFGVRSTRQHNHTGFQGEYTFVDEEWQPFDNSSDNCGAKTFGGHGGVITSPGYPNHFPLNTECTWMIRVEDSQNILLNVQELQLGQSALSCAGTWVSVWNGFASPSVDPDERICGQLYFFERQMFEFKSTHFRVVIRFVSGNSYSGEKNKGFKIAWTAITKPRTFINKEGKLSESCPDAECAGGNYCLDTNKMLCNPLPKYCIDHSLICDGINNCGAYDLSDETLCFLRNIYIVIGVLICVGLIAAITAIGIRRKRRKRALEEQAKMEGISNSDSAARKRKNYASCHINGQEKFRYKQPSSYTPVRQLSSPGYIAVYSPDKQGYSVYDEYDSESCLGRTDSRDVLSGGVAAQKTTAMSPQSVHLSPPVPHVPVRTCTVTSQSPHTTRLTHYTTNGNEQISFSESESDFDMYAMGKCRLNHNGKGPMATKNNVYTTPKPNPHSVTATV